MQKRSEEETKVSNWPELVDMSIFEGGHGAMTALVDEIAGEMDLPSSQVLALVRRLSGRKRELAGEITTTVLMETVLRSPKVLAEIDRRRGVVAVETPSAEEIESSDALAGFEKLQRELNETLIVGIKGIRLGKRGREVAKEFEKELREDFQAGQELLATLRKSGR